MEKRSPGRPKKQVIKAKTNITLDPDIKARAIAVGINISEICQAALEQELEREASCTNNQK